MKIAKRFGIWLAGILVILLIVNAAATLLAKAGGTDILMPSLKGYSKKMIFTDEMPTDEKEAKGMRAKLGVRALLSDIRFADMGAGEGENGLRRLLFSGMCLDESIIFTSSEGVHDFSEGIYAAVYDEQIEGVKLVQTIGLIELRAFAKTEGVDALTEVLLAHPDAVIQLNAYTMEGLHITPVTVTVTSADGASEYLKADFPATGAVIESDTCYIVSDEQDSLGSRLALAQMGERASDRAAHKLLESFPFGQANVGEGKNHYAIGSIMSTWIETSADGNGMITVVRIGYLRTVLIATAVLGAVLTAVLLIIFIVKDRRTGY